MKSMAYKKRKRKKQIKTGIIIFIWLILIGLFLTLILWKNRQVTVNGTLLKTPAAPIAKEVEL